MRLRPSFSIAQESVEEDRDISSLGLKKVVDKDMRCIMYMVCYGVLVNRLSCRTCIETPKRTDGTRSM